MDKKLTNFIAKQNVIDSDLCNEIIEESKSFDWVKHQWYSNHTKQNTTEENDLDVCHGPDIPQIVQEQLMMHVNAVWKPYVQMLHESLEFDDFNMVKFWSACRMNKYTVGTEMKSHYDHIHSLFDGEVRGIPIISVVGCLNDNFEGGEFVFYDDFKIELKQGDILLFPSNFLYPHRVEKITSGERYTFVSWGF